MSCYANSFSAPLSVPLEWWPNYLKVMLLIQYDVLHCGCIILAALWCQKMHLKSLSGLFVTCCTLPRSVNGLCSPFPASKAALSQRLPFLFNFVQAQIYPASPFLNARPSALKVVCPFLLTWLGKPSETVPFLQRFWNEKSLTPRKVPREMLVSVCVFCSYFWSLSPKR